MGPGWGATFRVNVSVGRGTLTDARHLGELVELQRQLAREPGVAAVIGPSALTAASDEVSGISERLALFEREANAARPQLADLRRTVATARDVIAELKGGLGRAGGAGSQLAGGAGRAHAAAAELTTGIDDLRTATSQLAAGLSAAQQGAAQLAQGSTRAAGGASQLLAASGGAATALQRSAPLIDRLVKALTTGAKSIGALRLPAEAAQSQVQVGARRPQGDDDRPPGPPLPVRAARR